MSRFASRSSALASLGLVAMLAILPGCEEEKGAAEKLGEAIDQSVEEAGDAVEEAVEKAEEAVDKASE